MSRFRLPKHKAAMQHDDTHTVQGSMQEFLPLQELYDKNMAYAIEERKSWEDGVPEDDAPRQTRLRKQRHADYVLWHQKAKAQRIPMIDLFIKALPGMLADAEKEQFGPDETFVMRSCMGCNCTEKSGSCAGHVFEFDQYFRSWTDENATCPNSPTSPSSP
jgi:hypothetical protein